MFLHFSTGTVPTTGACLVERTDGQRFVLLLFEQEPDGAWLTSLRPAADLRGATDPHATSYLDQGAYDLAVADLGPGYRFLDTVEPTP